MRLQSCFSANARKHWSLLRLITLNYTTCDQSKKPASLCHLCLLVHAQWHEQPI